MHSNAVALLLVAMALLMRVALVERDGDWLWRSVGDRNEGLGCLELAMPAARMMVMPVALVVVGMASMVMAVFVLLAFLLALFRLFL